MELFAKLIPQPLTERPPVKERGLYEVIRTRRSIRSYEQRLIPQAILDRVFEAALWAPSGKNVQNWHFFVLTDEKRDGYLEISQKAWEFVRPSLEKRLKPSLLAFTQRFFFTLGDAPVVVLAYAEKIGINNAQTEIGNVYMAVQNLALAAEQEGLGTCIMGSVLEIEEDVNRFLGIQDQQNLKLICGITLGYPAHQPPAAERKGGRITWMR